jgi:hypothetical protein
MATILVKLPLTYEDILHEGTTIFEQKNQEVFDANAYLLGQLTMVTDYRSEGKTAKMHHKVQLIKPGFKATHDGADLHVVLLPKSLQFKYGGHRTSSLESQHLLLSHFICRTMISMLSFFF